MQKHQLLHEGIKPYSCPVCFIAFTQQSNLKKHMETHNNGHNPPKQICGICNKAYSHPVNLLKHIKTCYQKSNAKDSVMDLCEIKVEQDESSQEAT